MIIPVKNYSDETNSEDQMDYDLVKAQLIEV